MSMATEALPGLVSVIAPCRNERAHVLAFCDMVAAQRLPDGVQLEVLIADGGSDDGTRELLAERCARDARFVLVDNPGRIVSTGLNRCLAQSRGAVIVRLDLHSRYAEDYVFQCLAALARSGADNVGGPWHAEGEGGWQRAIAAAFQSRWVAGGARSRDLDYEGEVDTVYLGCWPRASFERYGDFDESLVRNQDDEHNLRLTSAGGRIWQSTLIRSRYTPRASLAQLFAQQRQYGYWKPFVMAKHGRAGSLRQLVPGGFIAALALLGAASLLAAPARSLLALLLVAYASYVLLVALAVAREHGEPALLGRVAAVIATMHLGYGLGSLRGWWDVLRHRRPAPAYGALTR